MQSSSSYIENVDLKPQYRVAWFDMPAILFSCILFAWLLFQGVVIDADSPSYINMGILRSPLYPSLIKGFQIIFGEGQFLPIIVFQLCLLMFSAFYLAKVLREHIDISRLTYYLILAALLLPFATKWGNFLLSQGLAYPLFLITIAQFFQALYRKKMGHLLNAFLFLTLLILTRKQFMFMYIIFSIAILYFKVFCNISIKRTALLFLMLISSFLIADGIEKSYHYYVNLRFTTVPHLGAQLIVAPLYLASANDVHLFKEQTEKNIFLETFDIMRAKCMHADCLFQNANPPYQHFYLNYNNIHLGALWPVALKYTEQDFVQMDKTTIKMSGILIAKHWQRWLRLYFGNIVNNLGGYYFTVWLCLFFIVSFISHVKYRDKFSISCFFIILITFGNYSLIALVEPAMAPYTFYTNSLLLSFVIIFIMRFLNNPFVLDRKTC